MHRSLVAGFSSLAFLMLAATASAGGPASRYYAADTDGIFWFLHVSDLHFDTNAPVPTAHLQFALGEAFEVANPIAVFASGDLVNGTVLGVPTSGQDQAEWDVYRNTFDNAGLGPAYYYDMPGNHDGYGDHGLTKYLANSMQGQATGTLYSDMTYTTALGEYYFAAMNSAGTYDTPFSFGNPAFTNVDDLNTGLLDHPNAQLVFVFAHHHLVPHGDTDSQTALGIGGPDDPPSNVGDVVPLLQGVGAFYLHGHVHQYKESLQQNVVTVQIGSLGKTPAVDRSSLDTWDQTKNQCNVGIGIVDHNAFVYRPTDTTQPWPFVAITAPVDINLQGGGIPAGKENGVDYEGDYLAYGAEKNPYAYDVCGARTDNPVRALVLSKDPITSVKVALDSTDVGTMSPVANPTGIYAATIDTTGAEPGVHAITVTATSGTSVRTDSIQVNITAGPCSSISDAGVDAEEDGGLDADVTPDAGEDEAGQDAAPGPDAAGQDAGTSDAAQPDAAESDTGTAPPQADPGSSSDSGGCGCATPATRPSALSALAALALLALGRRRRRSS